MARRKNHKLMRKQSAIAILVFSFAFTRFMSVGAQNLAPRPLRKPIPTLTMRNGGQQKDDFIKPSRPTEAEPAEIPKVGVLQLEFGVDALFDAEEFRNQQPTPLRLRFAAASRLLLAFHIEVVKSQVDLTRQRMTGVSDVEPGVQVVAFKDTGRRPAVAFAYFSKLPSASAEKGLGSGRTDHRAVLLVSKQLGNFDLDFNAMYLNVGRDDSARRADGGLGAFAIEYKFGSHFGVTAELAGQSLEYSLPRGLYPLVAVTYQVNRRLRFDAGLRFGVGAEAPRVSVLAGLTVGVADLYGK
jgi:outer membrane putative beta-barrel porin/alpha-amylase